MFSVFFQTKSNKTNKTSHWETNLTYFDTMNSEGVSSSTRDDYEGQASGGQATAYDYQSQSSGGQVEAYEYEAQAGGGPPQGYDYQDQASGSQAQAIAYDYLSQASGDQAQAIDFTDNQMLLLKEDPALDDYTYEADNEESYNDFDFYTADQISSMLENEVIGFDHNGEDVFVPPPDNLEDDSTTVIVGIMKKKDKKISWHVCNTNGTPENVSFMPILKQVVKSQENCHELLNTSPLDSSLNFMAGAEAAPHLSVCESDMMGPMQSMQQMQPERRHFQQLSEAAMGPSAQYSQHPLGTSSTASSRPLLDIGLP